MSLFDFVQSEEVSGSFDLEDRDENRIDYLFSSGRIKEETYYKKRKLIESIKQLSKDEHIEIFKMLLDEHIPYSENNNGIFINLNNVKDSTLDHIINYIEYIQRKRDQFIQDDMRLMESKNLLGNSSKIVVNNFEMNKTIYKEYEFQENHEKVMNDKINEYLKDMKPEEIDPSKISLKRKKNKYHGNMAKLINSFKEPKEQNPQKYNQHKSYSEDK